MDLAYSHTQSQRVLKQRNMLLVTSLAFLVAALLWVWIPETRGRELR